MSASTDHTAGPQARKPPRLLLLFVLFLVPLLCWWLALWPGGWSTDSLNSWRQIQTGEWTNHHPLPFTALVWLTSFGGHVVATVPLAQTILVALALALLVRSIVRAFGGGRAPVVVGFLLCALPLLGPFSVVVWKDVPELAALLVVQAMLLDATDRAGRRRPGWWVLLAGCALAAALVRWNAVGTLLVASVVALFALPARLRWRAAAATAAAGAMGFAVLLTAPTWASVPAVSAADKHIDQLGDLANVQNRSPGWIPADGRAAMAEVAPLRVWAKQGRHCATSSTVGAYVVDARHRNAVVDRLIGRLDHAWYSVLRAHPGGLLKLRLCRAALAWSPVDIGGVGLHTVWTGVGPNRFGIHDGGWTALHRGAVDVVDVSHTAVVHALAWRPAVWVLALLTAALVAWRRPDDRSRRLALVAVPIGLLASYAVAPVAQSARFTYAAVVICQLSLAAVVQQWVSRRRGASR